MLIEFFLHLRNAKLPVSIKEYLTLLEAMRKHVIGQSAVSYTPLPLPKIFRVSYLCVAS